jgi:hypothetical protein
MSSRTAKCHFNINFVPDEKSELEIPTHILLDFERDMPHATKHLHIYSLCALSHLMASDDGVFY